MFVLTFGKHRFRPLAEVPASYLRWLLAECDYDREEWEWPVRRELHRREVEGDEGPDAGPRTRQGRGQGRQHDRDRDRDAPPSLTPAQLAGAVAAAFRDVARRWHPDRGGTKEAMQAASDFRDAVMERLGQLAEGAAA